MIASEQPLSRRELLSIKKGKSRTKQEVTPFGTKLCLLDILQHAHGFLRSQQASTSFACFIKALTSNPPGVCSGVPPSAGADCSCLVKLTA